MTTALVDSTGHALPATVTLPHSGASLEALRWQALQEFDAARVEMAKKLPSITRDGKIQIGGGKPIQFASFENIHSACMPILYEHGFYLSFQGEERNGTFWMVAYLRRNGCSITSEWPVDRAPVSKAMNPNQATGAGATYACRHAMVRLLNLRSHAPEDRDTDAVAPVRTVTEVQSKKLKAMIGDDQTLAALVENNWCKVLECTLDTFPADQANGLLNAIKKYKARKETGNVEQNS